jgi:type I restriction enzyme M protein
LDNTHNTQAQQQAELQKRLWSIANDLRGNMDASEYRNHILGLIFYRFLSDQVSDEGEELFKNDPVDFETAYQNPDDQEDIKQAVIEHIGFFIEPKYLFDSLIKDIKAGNFDTEKLQNAINEVQLSTVGHESENDFRGLFADMDLGSNKLGATVSERGKMIAKVMLALADINFRSQDMQIDVLGDAYEYLIGQFAASAGKKAGEFYTPQQVSKILAQIVTLHKHELRSVYDPTMGSGSLLLQVGNYVDRIGEYYGQELNTTTYNLARMNLLMHGVNFSQFQLFQGDTLENDKVGDKQFDAVVANPPYSANWDPTDKIDDERFRKYGRTAPKSKADFAFVEHMLYHLNETGIMGVVLPHGVLFRGAAEGAIRQFMLEQDNVLDAVIGLPANLFYGTSIPTVILIFKKDRDARNVHDVLFIDASKDFEKGKNQNSITDDQIKRIVETYDKRKDVDKYAHVASFDEIKENEFNLNIPRYVDTTEPEKPVDVVKVVANIKKADEQIAELSQALAKDFDDLVANNDEAAKQLTALKELFKNE